MLTEQPNFEQIFATFDLRCADEVDAYESTGVYMVASVYI